MSDTDAAPISRLRRRRLIADLIRAHPVLSQEELVERLGQQGLRVTQATVSRDLADLGAVKVRRRGALCYALASDVAAVEAPDARLRKVLAGWVESLETAGGLIVLKGPPGCGQIVGSALDSAGWPEIAGTIAGDDTTLAVVRDGYPADEVLARLRELAR